MNDDKPCERCDGSGECPECQGECHVTCYCDCGDEHEAECDICERDGKCWECEGTGIDHLSDLDREQAGQLTLGIAA
jgi:hypothetical protein